MGISVGIEKIMTSSYATALYLRENGKPDGCAFVVGESGIVHELESAGIRVVRDEDISSVDYVVVGIDRKFNYEKLTQAQQAILAGAKFIATNRDATFPIENGRVVPGGGAIVSAIETASGVKPILIGKPESYALDKILELEDSKPSESIIIGDRLETDILLGNRLGMHTVLVLTGVSDERAANAAPPEMKPERIITSLIELLDESWLAQ
jgi:HAD superfamily hydrolase (TIGR01450 family)